MTLTRPIGYTQAMASPIRPAITLGALSATFTVRGDTPPTPGRPVLIEIDGGGTPAPLPTGADSLDEAGVEEVEEPGLDVVPSRLDLGLRE